MDEFVNVDGRMYKLSYQQPLTQDERNGVIQQIRSGAFPGTQFNTMQPQTLGYGNPSGASIVSLAPTCRTGTVGSGTTITLNAAPMAGVGPYNVTFYKQIGGTVTSIAGPIINVPEATSPTVGTVPTPPTYTITDADVAGSTGSVSITSPPLGTLPILASGNIRFIVHIVDSCPTGGLACTEICDQPIVCVPPTCNFIIT